MSSNKKIFKNMVFLTIAEIANKGMLFVSTAYLTRIILAEGMGIIGYANSILSYFLILVNLGFNIVGQREIAKFPELIKKYVNSIITIRLLLSIISFT